MSPWPYTLADAEAFVTRPRGARASRHSRSSRTRTAPRLVGGIGVHCEEDTAEFGYWLTPDVWGRGYATEAGRAVISMAQHALPLTRLKAWHFVDNPASARVLAKLGFRPTGEVVAKASAGRTGVAPCVAYALDLEAARAPMPLAA